MPTEPDQLDDTAQLATHTVWLAVLFEGGMFLVAMAVNWWFELSLPERLRWDLGHAFWALAATGPLLLMMLWTSRSRLGPLVRFRKVVDEVVVPMFRDCSYAELALISVLAGLGEEALFRGVIQVSLSGPLGDLAAIAITGLLFGLVHWVTTTYFVLATVIGIYFGCLLVFFDNLLVPMAVHAVYDFLALLYLTRGQGTAETPTAKDEQTDIPLR